MRLLSRSMDRRTWIKLDFSTGLLRTREPDIAADDDCRHGGDHGYGIEKALAV